MKISLLTAAFLPVVSVAAALLTAKMNYNGFKSLRIALSENAEGVVERINQLATTVLGPESQNGIDIIVSPENIDAIHQLDVNTTVLIEDIGKAITRQHNPASIYRGPSDYWFATFHPFEDHGRFLQDVQAMFPNQSEIFTAGTSAEGQPLTGIHVWGAAGKGSRPAVIVHGTSHAREWVTTAMAEYVAFQLLTKYETDATIRRVVDKFDFYITPVANPDGFAYSKTFDRFWWKNRQPNPGTYCTGRDLNHNWPYNWELPGGAATEPCAVEYRGAAAADAPEVQGLKAQIDELAAGNGVQMFLDFHNYGQYISWPFATNCTKVHTGNDALNSLAQRFIEAIDAQNNYRGQFKLGHACRTRWFHTGMAMDYAYGVGKAVYAYTIDMRDLGRYGHVIPSSLILPWVEETWLGVLAMLQESLSVSLGQ
ncbi:Metallocarboxypeptidase A [Colletotrichum chlorophyti]|uniref:Metallocarboxypeptidase A n=1 Tax=Colletotrichum chlorophyti TaxID=708187 RepID=A0A1Q8S852_9PEZI|nr:Metallocarboxypeptidase A [Colletotrichum chlorophyti]